MGDLLVRTRKKSVLTLYVTSPRNLMILNVDAEHELLLAYKLKSQELKALVGKHLMNQSYQSLLLLVKPPGSSIELW